MQNNLL